MNLNGSLERLPTALCHVSHILTCIPKFQLNRESEGRRLLCCNDVECYHCETKLIIFVLSYSNSYPIAVG